MTETQTKTRSAAAQWLQLAASANYDDARREFVHALQRDGFLPPIKTQGALGLVGDNLDVARFGPLFTPDERDALQHEERLRAAIDVAAGQFFQRSPAWRREQWLQLCEQAAGYPRQIARLASWLHCLDLPERAATQDDRVERLVSVIEQFAVGDRRRGMQLRWSLVREMDEGPWLARRRWRIAARRLRRREPKLAQVGQPVLSHLDRKRNASWSWTSAFAKPAPKPTRKQGRYDWLAFGCILLIPFVMWLTIRGGPERPKVNYNTAPVYKYEPVYPNIRAEFDDDWKRPLHPIPIQPGPILRGRILSRPILSRPNAPLRNDPAPLEPDESLLPPSPND